MAAVSVTATVLNEFEDIDRLVTSLAQQTLVPAEIVIVDGGSTDGTWERLQAAQSKYPNLVPIRDESCSLQRSPGPIARGRNVAISAATSDVVACADAGCSYDPNWLERLDCADFERRSRVRSGRVLPRSGGPHAVGHRLRPVFSGSS